MRLPSFIRLPRYRRYDYHPRYGGGSRGERTASSNDSAGEELRTRLQTGWRRKTKSGAQHVGSTQLRLIIFIFLILSCLVYLFYGLEALGWFGLLGFGGLGYWLWRKKKRGLKDL